MVDAMVDYNCFKIGDSQESKYKFELDRLQLCDYFKLFYYVLLNSF